MGAFKYTLWTRATRMSRPFSATRVKAIHILSYNTTLEYTGSFGGSVMWPIATKQAFLVISALMSDIQFPYSPWAQHCHLRIWMLQHYSTIPYWLPYARYQCWPWNLCQASWMLCSSLTPFLWVLCQNKSWPLWWYGPCFTKCVTSTKQSRDQGNLVCDCILGSLHQKRFLDVFQGQPWCGSILHLALYMAAAHDPCWDPVAVVHDVRCFVTFGDCTFVKAIISDWLFTWYVWPSSSTCEYKFLTITFVNASMESSGNPTTYWCVLSMGLALQVPIGIPCAVQ